MMSLVKLAHFFKVVVDEAKKLFLLQMKLTTNFYS